MEPSGNEYWVPIGVFLGTAFAAFIGYFRKVPPPKTPDPVIAGIAVGFGDREQSERVITEIRAMTAEVRGCRVALEVLADRRTEEIEDMQQKLLEQLDRAEALTRRPHRPTRRRT
ncbi:hypothetical protein [Mesorhizobium sp. 128a]